MVRTAKGAKAEGDHVSSAELPAPAGWKKFITKKAGASKRSEIVFISPIGKEIRNKKQLGQYLRSHPGGPSSSEFDWGSGGTPRRSARLIEKTKETETPEEMPPKKRGRRSGSKKAVAKKRVDTDSDVEVDTPEEEPPKKQTRHSTLKKGTKQKKKMVNVGIKDGAAENDVLATQTLDGVEDAEMKDAADGSVEGNEEAAAAKAVSEGTSAETSDGRTKQKKDSVDAEVVEAPKSENIATEALENEDAMDISLEEKEEAHLKAIMEGSYSKVDSKDGSKQKKDVVAEAEHEALQSVKIVATEALEGVEDSNMKVAEVASAKAKAEAAAKAIMEESFVELNSDRGTKQKKANVDVEVEGEALASEQIVIQAIRSVEDSDMNDAGDGSVKGKRRSTANSIMLDSFAEVDSNDYKDAVIEDEAPPCSKIATHALESIEDSDRKEYGSVNVKEEAADKDNMQDRSATVESNDVNKQNKNVDTVVDDEAQEIEKLNTKVLKSIEDADRKDDEDGSVKGIEEPVAKSIMEFSSSVEEDNAEKDANQDSTLNLAGKEENELEEQVHEEPGRILPIISIPEVANEENALDRENQVDSELASHEEEPCKEDFHKAGKTLLNNNHKGEQVSPSKAVPTANCIDLKSPEKASALV